MTDELRLNLSQFQSNEMEIKTTIGVTEKQLLKNN